jgi:hypothetical protein
MLTLGPGTSSYISDVNENLNGYTASIELFNIRFYEDSFGSLVNFMRRQNCTQRFK